MSVSREDEIFFGTMCEDSLIRQYEREMQECMENAICSRRHYRRVSKIIGVRVGPRPTVSGKLIVLLVAAMLLLLSTCAAVAYWEPIKGFFGRLGENYLLLASAAPADSERAAGIEEVYELTYVPEGYELVEKDVSPTAISYQWENKDGCSIYYIQRREMTSIYLDNMNVNSRIWNLSTQELYCSVSENMNQYVWYSNGYCHCLRTDLSVSEMEVGQIVTGIKSK